MSFFPVRPFLFLPPSHPSSNTDRLRLKVLKMIENFVRLITGQCECLLCTYNPPIFNLFIYEETEAQYLNDLPKSFSKWQREKKKIQTFT